MRMPPIRCALAWVFQQKDSDVIADIPEHTSLFQAFEPFARWVTNV